MFISPWVQCPQVQKNIGIRNVSRCHIKKSTLPHGHNFPIGGNHSPCENAHQQPQCPWGLDKSWATHGPSWSPYPLSHIHQSGWSRFEASGAGSLASKGSPTWLWVNTLDPAGDSTHRIFDPHNMFFFQWIGLREKLQENPIFNGKIHGFL